MKRSPPDARSVARRAITLKFVSLQAISCQDAALVGQWREEMPADQWRAMVASSRAIHTSYLRDARRWKCSFSPREKEFMLRRDTLMLPERLHIDMTWRCESLGVLAWALRFHARLPAPRQPSLVDDLHNFMGNSAEKFISQARLRPRRELQYARELSAARLRRDRGRQAADPPFRWDVIGIAKLGREYYGDDWSPAVAFARERLHALNWLCGYAPGNRWDDTPADMEENRAVTSRGVPRPVPARGPIIAPRRGVRRRIVVPSLD